MQMALRWALLLPNISTCRTHFILIIKGSSEKPRQLHPLGGHNAPLSLVMGGCGPPSLSLSPTSVNGVAATLDVPAPSCGSPAGVDPCSMHGVNMSVQAKSIFLSPNNHTWDRSDLMILTGDIKNASKQAEDDNYLQASVQDFSLAWPSFESSSAEFHKWSRESCPRPHLLQNRPRFWRTQISLAS